jgi:hypothetical protein
MDTAFIAARIAEGAAAAQEYAAKLSAPAG